MQEQLVLLKRYILNAPASQDEHQQALEWLQQIVNQYNQKLQQMQKELDNQQEESDGKQ